MITLLLRARAALPFSAVLALWAAGCPGGVGGPFAPRLTSVHNTLDSMGYVQVGPLSMGSLPPGESIRLPISLEQGACYALVGMGGEGVADVELTLQSPAGETLAHDEDVDPHASIYHCAQSSGRYTLTLKTASGGGEYLVAAWTGAGNLGSARGGPGRTGSGRSGSCDNPLPLSSDESVSGDTSSGQSQISSSCAEGSAPEVVYSFHLAERAAVSVRLESAYDGVLYLQRECGQATAEVGCNDDSPDTTHSRVDAMLDPGTYFVVVDGYGGNSGTFTLVMTTAPGQPIAEICANAQPLGPGAPIQGSTAGQADNFRATCGNGAQSPDRVYRLEVPQPSRVRITQQTPQYDGVLHVRRSCEDAATELQCNDDFLDRMHSLVRLSLDPGTYYVFADGYATGAAGDFTVQAELAPRAGGGAPNDTCADPRPLTGSGTVQGDTFSAADDVQPSCAPVPGAPDQVYRLDLSRRSRVRLSLERPEFTNGAIAIMRSCGDRATEIACGANGVDAILAAGSYYVVVDANAADSFGRYDLTVAIEDTAQMEAACRSARPLRSGQSLAGSTAAPDRFQASCGNAMSGESLHKLVVRRRSTVRLAVDAAYDAVLYVRRECMDRATELQCNDDSGDQQHSLVETTFEPGTYWVFVDGYGASSHGTFSLQTTITPQ